jgi:hypothetical protein
MAGDEAILKLHADAAVLASTLAKGLFPHLPEDTKNIISMAQAAERLGITLSVDLKKSAADAAAALKVLDMEYKAGQISLRDLQSAQMKALQSQIEYDKEMGKAPALVMAEEKELDKLRTTFDKLYPEIKKTQTFWDAFTADFKKKAKETSTTGEQMGQVLANAAKQMDTAFATAIIGAIESGKSIGAALEQATKAILTQLAEQALAKSLYYTAEGIAAATMGDPQASGFFAAAGEFALVAGAALGGAMLMGGGGGGRSSQQGPSVGQTTSSSGGGGGSNQTVGVTHLAAGGIVTRRTMIGDSPSGGDADEAIIPLSDPAAWDRITNSLLSTPTLRAASAGMGSNAAMVAASGAAPARSADPDSSSRDSSGSDGSSGDTHIHMNIKGMVSPDNAKKFLKQVNRMVQNRQTTLNASNSLRVTRRSQ